MYIYIYTHTYIHTYVRTYIHTCIHAYIHTYIHTCCFAERLAQTLNDVQTALKLDPRTGRAGRGPCEM